MIFFFDDLLSFQQLPVDLLVVDRLPPAAQSLLLAEQRAQPAVLPPKLVDFFFFLTI